MAEKRTLNFSSVELSIQREPAYCNKAPSPKTTLARTPSFMEWMSISRVSPQSYLALPNEPSSPKVIEFPRLPSPSPQRDQIRTGQSSIKDEPYSSEPLALKDCTGNSSYYMPLLVQPNYIELPRLPSPSPQPDQNRTGQISVKDEPYSSEPSSPISPTSAFKGSTNFPTQKIRTRSSYKLPLPGENPALVHRKTPSPKIDPIQQTINPARSRENRFNAPTKPRLTLKRKATTQNEQHKKSVDSLVCKICEASCSSEQTMQQHLSGRPHKAKVEWMKLKRSGGGKPMCEVCKIWCSDRDALEMHLKGQKHRAKVREVNGSVDKRPILCEVCGVHSMNEELFKMHLKGKQHVTRQELNRRGMLL